MPFETPSKYRSPTLYWERADSNDLKRQSSMISQGKSVTFDKYLHHEDLILHTFKDISKEDKFKDSLIFNKLESVMELLNERDHFQSTLKLIGSVERTTRTRRKSSSSNIDPAKQHREGMY